MINKVEAFEKLVQIWYESGIHLNTLVYVVLLINWMALPKSEVVEHL